MASGPAISSNGAYLVNSDGTVRIPLKGAVLRAVQRMVEGKENGEVALQFKGGSNAGVTARTVYSE
jgi:hypothetical protein